MTVMLAEVGTPLDAEKVTLSGSSGSPNVATDNAISPADAEVSWEFRTDGSVWRLFDNAADSQFNAGVQWNPSPGIDYWIRFTLDAGDAANVGNTFGVWHKLAGAGSSNRSFGWREIQSGFQTEAGTAQVDIATDVAGSNIVATGFYRGVATVEL